MDTHDLVFLPLVVIFNGRFIFNDLVLPLAETISKTRNCLPK